MVTDTGNLMALYYYYHDITPSSIIPITAAGGIIVTHRDMKVAGDGGAVDITANPQIALGRNRQRVLIQGTHDVNTVQLDDGNGLILEGAVSCILGKNDIIELFCDLIEGVWIEMNRSDN